jgi:hypothetical protein
MVASGEMVALVAAGASTMYQIRQQESVDGLIAAMEDRITKLEDKIGIVASVEAVEVAETEAVLESAPEPSRTVVNNIYVNSSTDAAALKDILDKQ